MSDVCRTCLSDDTVSYRSVFEWVSGEDSHVYEMLSAVCDITVNSQDSLPKGVCFGCFQDLCKAFSFRRRCHSSEEKLKILMMPNEDIPLDVMVKEEQYIAGDTLASTTDIQIKEESIDMPFDDFEGDHSNDESMSPSIEIPMVDSKEDIVPNNENRLYFCSVCSAACDSKNALNQHQQIHLAEESREDHWENMAKQQIEGRFACDQCNHSSKTKYLLSSHMLTHTSERNYKCDLCDQAFKLKSTLVSHMKCVHATERTHVCYICAFSFKRRSHLVRHMATHVDERKHVCDQCGLTFKRSSHLSRHVLTHQQRGVKARKQYACDKCEYVTKLPKCLVKHALRHKSEKQYSDHNNGEDLLQRMSHLITEGVGEDGVDNYTCNMCNSSFSLTSHLIRHMAIHQDAKMFSCQLCKYSFKESSHLAKHMLTHEPEVNFKCNLCDFVTNIKKNLIKHLFVHEDKSHMCDICKSSFKRKYHLIRHMRIHNGTRKYDCTKCKSSFRFLSHLIRHRSIHEAFKKYVCEKCNASFQKNSHLIRHMSSHVETRLYTCDLCSSSFKRRYHLTRHKLTHRRENQ